MQEFYHNFQVKATTLIKEVTEKFMEISIRPAAFSWRNLVSASIANEFCNTNNVIIHGILVTTNAIAPVICINALFSKYIFLTASMDLLELCTGV